MKKIIISFAFILIFSVTNVAFAQVVSFGGLARGSKGPAVLALQKVLISQGYLGVNFATGNFGPLTFNALQKFQKAQGLAQVGRVGPATLLALNAISNVGANPSTSNANAGANTPAPQGAVLGNNPNIPPNIPNTPTNPPTNPPVPPTPPLPPTNPPTPPTPPVPPTPPPTTPTTPNPNPNARPCVAGTTPAYIKVESPNGGEVFNFGELIGVRWQTCNYQSRAVSIYLEYFTSNAGAPTITALAVGTPNDFGEQVTLPLLASVAGSGAYYKIAITDGPEPALATVLDESDALFTIK